MVHLDKEDPKGKEDKTEWSYLNIPDPDRREVSTFSSDKVSPILRPETKELSRGHNIMLLLKDISLQHAKFSNDFILSYFYIRYNCA